MLWNLYYADGPLPAAPESLHEVPASIDFEGREIRPVPVDLGKGVDLVEVLGLEPALGREALLVRVEHSDSDRIAYMGAFADWWCSLHVNGKEVDTTFPQGSEGSVFGVFNHLFPVFLRKGDNLLVFRVRSGLVAWWAACGEVPFAPATGPHETADYSRQAIAAFVLPPRARLLHGPRICRLTGEEACITFQTDGPMAAAVDFRVAGEDGWRRAHDAVGVIPNAHSDSHAITLRGLVPGTGYEYRVVLFQDYKTQGVPFPADGGVIRFTTFSEVSAPYGVFLAGDLQMEYPDREKALEEMKGTIGGRRFAFDIHLGDYANNNDLFERNTLVPMDLFPDGPYFPLVGNHERCGLESSDLNRFFFSDGRSYHAFRHGDAFWFLLDTGTDFDHLNDYGDLNTPLLEEEARWIENTSRTTACRTARWRIVASHHAPPNCATIPPVIPPRDSTGRANMAHHASILAQTLSRSCSIDLWLAGHTHSFARTFPGTNRFLATTPRSPGDYDATAFAPGPGLPCPVVIPEVRRHCFGATFVLVSHERLEIESVLSDGTVLDRFRIAPGGKISNLATNPAVGLYEYRTPEAVRLPDEMKDTLFEMERDERR